MRSNLFTRLRAALAFGVFAAVAPAWAQLSLYEHDNYGGRSFSANAATPNLSQAGFSDRASSVVVNSGRWQLCDDADFQGQCVLLAPGRYPSLTTMGMNDRVSSLREVSGPDGVGGWGGRGAAIELFEHGDFEGRSYGTTVARTTLATDGFNDRASSVLVRSGRWELCSDADFRGRCVTLGPGSYNDLRQQELNDKVSSVRPVAGWVAARPGSVWQPDDGSVPEIWMSSNRYARAVFIDGCVVYYDTDGRRFQNLPGCDGAQVRRADDSMARYRVAHGLGRSDGFHSWLRSRGGAAKDLPPEIVMGADRQGEVVFRNNCVAYYNAPGRRWTQQPTCSPAQLTQADQLMADYRRQQGF